MVHHDDALGRLTEGSGLCSDDAAEIKAVRFKASAGRILTLGEFCDLVAGRTTLLLEVKSRFDGDMRLARRAIDALSGYRGPVALMSFDPALVEFARHKASTLPRGIVAERHYSDGEWAKLPNSQKRSMSWLTACAVQPAAIHRLFGQGFTGNAAAAGPHDVRFAVADLDCTKRGGPQARRALGRPDPIRGLAAANPRGRGRTRSTARPAQLNVWMNFEQIRA